VSWGADGCLSSTGGDAGCPRRDHPSALLERLVDLRDDSDQVLESGLEQAAHHQVVEEPAAVAADVTMGQPPGQEGLGRTGSALGVRRSLAPIGSVTRARLLSSPSPKRPPPSGCHR
jgi:hypothetical protein